MQKQIIIGLILTIMIAVFIPVYWLAESGRQEAAVIRQHEEAVERASHVYSAACAACHGAEGEGIVGPALRNTRLDEKALAKTIARGVPGTAMVAWGPEDDGPLKDHQIKELVLFIKAWGEPLSEEPQSASAKTPDTETLTGGELFTARCIACHGADRQGILNLGLPLTPESLSELTDTEIRDTILNGQADTMMAAFKDTLTSEQIDSLVQFIKYTSP
ncbi:MAG: c-type cytochrome [Dehalococcoidales bacterium]|jgi:mono/diheme cytochrome c family protein|nr:c-type cytochrome [Dehalococcoidales bacterium]MDP6631947.1 c-type cytochrome [Dehalococcoidales bacterium]